MKTLILTVAACLALGAAHAQGKFGGGAGGGYAMLQSSSVLLPVELARFTVESHAESGALIRWATASEKGNHYFEVERSADGRAWEAVARESARGSGNSSQLTQYQVVDRAALPGTSFYRLRQVDRDGTATVSRVATYRATAIVPLLEPYPNPTSGVVFLNARPEQPTGSLLLTNADGKTVRVFETAPASLDLRALPPGVYFLRMGSLTRKVIRQ